VKARGLRGGARLTFTDVEREALEGLLGDLGDALAADGLQPGDPVYDRLYPDGYSGVAGPAEQHEFRDLTQSGLRDERVARLEECRSELVVSGTGDGRIEVDSDGFDRWLRVLNDLRLTLGTRLEIRDDDGHWDISPTDPRSTAHLLYAWLTEVQDTLVRLVSK
jgi:hypothetical protein